MNNYPIFNKEYIKEISDNTTNNFKKYLHYTNNIINKIQKESKQNNEIPLKSKATGKPNLICD